VDRVRGLSAVGYSWKLAKIELGVAADIKSVVTGYQPDADGLKKALTGAEIVLIPAGVPRKPGMTRDGIVYSREVSIG